MGRRSIFIVPIVIAMIGTTLFTSCKKKSSIQYTGTYPGALTYAGTTTTYADTVTISTGSNSSNIIIRDSRINITVNGTVNNSYITIAAQMVTGVADTISGVGNISGSNLTLYIDTNSVVYDQFMGVRE